MKRELRIKETAVKEQRLWVRLLRRCNNGCLFCLDSDSHDGTIESRDAIEELLGKGKESGAERLILSGGEPTIHPDFVYFVEFGRQLGFNWIQTVTNGRMFAYRRFSDSAVAAGLNEATFSLHGHTAELHDRLVGVQGAFEQALLGMRNLLNRIVVNVDVVLSKVNIPHLKEILEFYIGLGITEFDLLHMIPFGRAWSENRDILFYDPARMMPHFRRAFALRKSKRIIMWTNRLPAPFLEGCEDLIQDPHKFHDEVRGRMEMFEKWRDLGEKPQCLGDRCEFCPMMNFCRVLEEVFDELRAGTFEQVRTSTADLAGEAGPPGVASPLLSGLAADGRVDQDTEVTLVVEENSDLKRWLDAWAPIFKKVVLELETIDSCVPAMDEPAVAGVMLTRLSDADPSKLERFLGRYRTTRRAYLPTENGVEPLLEQLSPESQRQVILYQRSHEYLSESVECDLSPADVAELSERYGLTVEGLPRCLGGAGVAGQEGASMVDLTILDSSGRLDFVRFTDWFIASRYMVKSLRCGKCLHDVRCRGLHINAARNFGLGVLNPGSLNKGEDRNG